MIINSVIPRWTMASYISRCTQNHFCSRSSPDTACQIFKPQLLNKLVAINHEGWMGGGRTTNTSATIQTKAKGTDATTDRTHKQQQQNHNIQAKSVQCVFTDTTAVGGFPPFFVFFILSCSFVSLSREEKQQVYNPSHAFLSFLSFLSFFRFLSFASIPALPSICQVAL